MGEYEPDDSRKVTQTDNRAPGEPPRTGPREDEARRKAQDERGKKAAPMPQQKQKASQAQSQGRQSQSGRWRPDPPLSAPVARTGDPDRQAMQAEPSGPLAGNQPQAIDNPPGTARPKYDQYELNHPQNMHQQDAELERKVREQATRQREDRGFGYGGEGGAEMADAPGAGAEDADEAHLAEQRGYGGRGEAVGDDVDAR